MKGPIINGEPYSLIVLRVLEMDAQGRPSKCEIGYDGTEFRLDDPTKPNDFLTAFVKTDAIKGATVN